MVSVGREHIMLNSESLVEEINVMNNTTWSKEDESKEETQAPKEPIEVSDYLKDLLPKCKVCSWFGTLAENCCFQCPLVKYMS